MVGAITLRGVTKRFEREGGPPVETLEGIDLEISGGSFVSIIGPSGCGKSTLLRIIAGLLPPSAGESLIDGAAIDKPGRERGFVFQDHTHFPWLNIHQNIAFGLRTQGVYAERKHEVDEWIELVGLKGFEKSFPHQLSGGMCQRASLARALAVKPSVLLLDEPLGALDAFTRMNMQDELLRIWEASGTTMVMVTHDIDEAIYMSGTIVIFTPRPGRVDRVIPIELARPRARSGEDFIYYHRKILDHMHFGGHPREVGYYL
jgi:ABC-type nitrate/sulfonate/bicarbonate transport system ATPase subunit